MKKPLTLLLVLFISLWAGAQDQALVLDGAGDHVYVNNSPSLSELEEVSVAAWVRFTNTSGTMSIARQGGSNSPSFSLNKENFGYFLFWVHVNGAWHSSGTAGTPPVADVWYHVVGTYDGAAISMYINGELVNSVPLSGPLSISTDIFSIGCDVDPFAAYMHGRMDEMSIWNKALGTGQVQAIMNDTLGAAYTASADSGLVAYWRFDVLEDLGVNGGGVDDVRDHSIHGNHGDLVEDALLDPSITALAVANAPDPTGYYLGQNQPNPFVASTRITYGIPVRGLVDMRVFDAAGKEVRTLVRGTRDGGLHTVEFDAGQLASGTYFVRLVAGAYSNTVEVVLER